MRIMILAEKHYLCAFGLMGCFIINSFAYPRCLPMQQQLIYSSHSPVLSLSPLQCPEGIAPAYKCTLPASCFQHR